MDYESQGLSKDIIDRRDYQRFGVNAAEEDLNNQLFSDNAPDPHDLIDDRFLDEALRRFLNPDEDYFEEELEDLVEREAPDRLDFWNEDDYWSDKRYTPEWNTKREQRVAEETAKGATPGSPAHFQAAQAANMPNKKQANTNRWYKKYENGKIPITALAPIQKGKHHLRQDAAAAFKAMARAARKDGITISITDSYRSYDQQVALKAAKPTLAATPGTSVHGWGMALDVNVNDPKVYKWLQKHGKKYGWENPDWAKPGGSKPEPWHFEWGGGYSVSTKGGNKKQPKTTARRPKPKAEYNPVGLIGSVSPMTGSSAFAEGFLSAVDEMHYEAAARRPSPKSGGKEPAGGKGVKGQLIRGFMDAGREDLAQMVRTGAFDTWIGQESGWRTGVVSPANNQGRPNGGLFQIWEGHDWARKFFKNGKFTASAYEQAMLVAKHFSHLTPQAIRQYARAIRQGSYKGWG